MSLIDEVVLLGQKARRSARLLARVKSEDKNHSLLLMAKRLELQQDLLLKENKKDLESAQDDAILGAFLDRITLDPRRIQSMANGLRDVAKLPDPVGDIVKIWRRPNGLQVGRMRIPLGVVGMIYEARPNVTADASALCVKSGNAVILRGGSEAYYSNQAIGKILAEACVDSGIPEEAIQVVASRDRGIVKELLCLEDYIDLIIPRGGEDLIRMVAENARIPVIKHYKGVCHVYVDNEASLLMAERICMNAKIQRFSVCNSMETLLVHESIAGNFIPSIAQKLRQAGVEIRGCEKTCKLVPEVTLATATDWSTEYLDLILSVCVVKDVDDAIDHIEQYGSQHTETIITSNHEKARMFLNRVDSSAVLVNASTRFNDGGELGLGAEIGISTSKIHAFGPMGLEELTTTKFIVYGDGQIRE